MPAAASYDILINPTLDRGVTTGMSIQADVVVIGAGIAGASVGYFLSETLRVLVLERENQPGYHSTGRSAALFTETYGNDLIRGLTMGSRDFLSNPPDGFCDTPLLTPRGVLYVADQSRLASLEDQFQVSSNRVASVRRVDTREILRAVPIFKPSAVAAGFFEPDAMDINVAGLHQAYLTGIKRNNGRLFTNADVIAVNRVGTSWEISTANQLYLAPIVVNASGAWCDTVGALAKAQPIGLVPKRRTAVLFQPGDGLDVSRWPMCIDIDEHYYFKPDAGKILASPADETPVLPCDVQPEELDVAIAVERLQHATHFDIRRLSHSWAGLRSFVEDRSPVAGFDEVLEGFFWLAGQGGFGIKTSPAMGQLSAALIGGQSIPRHLQALGLDTQALSPARFAISH